MKEKYMSMDRWERSTGGRGVRFTLGAVLGLTGEDEQGRTDEMRFLVKRMKSKRTGIFDQSGWVTDSAWDSFTFPFCLKWILQQLKAPFLLSLRSEWHHSTCVCPFTEPRTPSHLRTLSLSLSLSPFQLKGRQNNTWIKNAMRDMHQKAKNFFFKNP